MRIIRKKKMIKISICRQTAVNADQSAGDERSSVGG